MLDGLDIYIRLLEQYQIRATMFAVCRTALREQERVQRYVDRGHRLALHGLEHVPPRGMDDEHFRRATLAGKQQLEAALSHAGQRLSAAAVLRAGLRKA